MELLWEKNGTELVAVGFDGSTYRIETTKGKRFKLHVEGQPDALPFSKKTDACVAAQELENAKAAAKATADREAKEKELAEAAAKAAQEQAEAALVAYVEPEVRSSKGFARVTAIAGDLPVKFPQEPAPENVVQWVEDARDYGEANGRHYTAGALVSHVGSHMLNREHPGFKILVPVLRHQLDMESRAANAPKVETATGNAAAAKPAKAAGNAAAQSVPVQNPFQAQIPVTMSEGAGGGKRFTVWDMPVTGLLRWMGSEAFTVKQARTFLNALGLTEVKEPTLQAQIRSGAKGDAGSHGPVPDVSEDRSKAVYAVWETVKG